VINIDKFNIPIYNVVKKYIDTNPTAFHMPGHKLGRGIPAEILKNLAAFDVTEIPGTDNLHYPEEAIKEAQDLAAKAFGAKETFFLVNGSTCGIHAAIMTMCKKGDKLIVPRDCHKSVISGMMLAGAEPVYIRPEYMDSFGIPGTVTAESIERALEEHRDAVGVFLTRPNYYGICSDIEKIVSLVHSYGKIVAVDEAHGAHLSFCEKLPVSAMKAGADICIQSAHKTLPAFTQGAYLHVGSDKINIDRLKFFLGMLQTSSPSYIIMMLLDIARAVMEEQGSCLLERLLHNIDLFEEKVRRCAGVRLLKDEILKEGRHDATRLVINFHNAGITGFEADKILRERFNIQVEMADMKNIVCICTVADSSDDFERLYEGIKTIAPLKQSFNKPQDFKNDIIVPKRAVNLGEVLSSDTELVSLKDAAGKASWEMITPYPPGIPLVSPGEVITEEIIKIIFNIINNGGKINGIYDNMKVKIIRK